LKRSALRAPSPSPVKRSASVAERTFDTKRIGIAKRNFNAELPPPKSESAIPKHRSEVVERAS